jgi:hypothetical protein
MIEFDGELEPWDFKRRTVVRLVASIHNHGRLISGVSVILVAEDTHATSDSNLTECDVEGGPATATREGSRDEENDVSGRGN